MTRRKGAEQAAKAVLLVVTLVLMASMGGGFLALPLLIPAHIWAARRSPRSVGRVGWSLLPAASVGMVAWAAVYVSLGEVRPTIWLAPLLTFGAALVVAVRAAA